MTDSYILYNATRYDIKGRQFLKTFGKYYFVDSGIRNHIISQSARDFGHLLENVVYLELLRSNMNEVEYYRGCASVIDEKTLERELASLKEIKDNYPKTLLTLDDVGNGAN